MQFDLNTRMVLLRKGLPTNDKMTQDLTSASHLDINSEEQQSLWSSP